MAPIESATAESGTATEVPLAETIARVPKEAEPLLEAPVEENVDTPAPVESIQVIGPASESSWKNNSADR